MESKTFDCIQMKDEIQQELRAEYENRKEEFTSYGDFVNTTAHQTEEIRRFCESVERAKRAGT